MKLHLLTLFTGLSTAWSVAFYTGDNCNGDATFNNANYQGFSQGTENDDPWSDCIIAGDDAYGCQWYMDNASNGPFQCTGPMTPAPGSVYVPPGTQCIVTWGDSCYYPPWPIPSNSCLQIIKLPNGFHNTVVSFKCRTA